MKHMVNSLFVNLLLLLTKSSNVAGYAYCAIATLSLLGRIPKLASSQAPETSTAEDTLPGLTNLPETVRWLMLRQMPYSDGDNEEKDETDDTQTASDHHFVPDLDTTFVGFNGRCNKSADTCYTFWVGASLDVSIYTNLYIQSCISGTNNLRSRCSDTQIL